MVRGESLLSISNQSPSCERSSAFGSSLLVELDVEVFKACITSWPIIVTFRLGVLRADEDDAGRVTSVTCYDGKN